MKECGISHNTFYYHYQDIYALLEAFFHQYIMSYTVEDGRMDWAEMARVLLNNCKDNKRLVYHAFNSLSRERLERVVFDSSDDFFSAYVRQLAGDRPIKRVVVDPSAASFIAALRKRGFTVIQANNDVLDGIRRVAEYLRAGNIKIHRSCGACIQEFGLYRWDDSAAADRPIKENDHAMDDVRYFAAYISQPRESFFCAAVKR